MTRKRWIALALLAAVACFAFAYVEGAQAFTLHGPARYHRYLARSHVVAPPGEATVILDPPMCGGVDDGANACTDLENGIIYLAWPLDRFGFEHEIGHLFDARVLTDGARHRFGTLIRDHGPWWDNSLGDGDGPASVAEKFADAYATCALGMRPDGYRTRHGRRYRWTVVYGYLPQSNRVQRRVCGLIRRARPSTPQARDAATPGTRPG